MEDQEGNSKPEEKRPGENTGIYNRLEIAASMAGTKAEQELETIERLKQELTEREEALRQGREELQRLRKESEELINERREYTGGLNRAREETSIAEDRIQGLEQQVTDFTAREERTREELQAIDGQLTRAEEKLDQQMRTKLSSIEPEIQKLEAYKAKVEQRLASLYERKDSIHEAVERKTQGIRSTASEKKERLQTDLENIEARREEISFQLSEENASYGKTEKVREAYEKRVRETDIKITELDEKINQLTESIESRSVSRLLGSSTPQSLALAGAPAEPEEPGQEQAEDLIYAETEDEEPADMIFTGPEEEIPIEDLTPEDENAITATGIPAHLEGQAPEPESSEEEVLKALNQAMLDLPKRTPPPARKGHSQEEDIDGMLGSFYQEETTAGPGEISGASPAGQATTRDTAARMVNGSFDKLPEGWQMITEGIPSAQINFSHEGKKGQVRYVDGIGLLRTIRSSLYNIHAAAGAGQEVSLEMIEKMSEASETVKRAWDRLQEFAGNTLEEYNPTLTDAVASYIETYGEPEQDCAETTDLKSRKGLVFDPVIRTELKNILPTAITSIPERAVFEKTANIDAGCAPLENIDLGELITQFDRLIERLSTSEEYRNAAQTGIAGVTYILREKSCVTYEKRTS